MALSVTVATLVALTTPAAKGGDPEKMGYDDKQTIITYYKTHTHHYHVVIVFIKIIIIHSYMSSTQMMIVDFLQRVLITFCSNFCSPPIGSTRK